MLTISHERTHGQTGADLFIDPFMCSSLWRPLHGEAMADSSVWAPAVRGAGWRGSSGTYAYCSAALEPPGSGRNVLKTTQYHFVFGHTYSSVLFFCSLYLQ